MSRVEQLDISIALEPIAPHGRIGLLALASDFNIEQELRRMLPEGVEIFTNRVLNLNPLTIENLRTMTRDISRAAAGILPDRRLDVMIFACTSGAVAIGSSEIERHVQASRPGAVVTNPARAALAAFESLRARRISVLTPYTGEIDRALKDYFNRHGVEVVNIAGLGFENDSDITGIPAAVLHQAARQVSADEADALFISCTALRTANLIDALEHDIGKPVVSSNQALAWHALRLMNYHEAVQGLGQLLRGQSR